MMLGRKALLALSILVVKGSSLIDIDPVAPINWISSLASPSAQPRQVQPPVDYTSGQPYQILQNGLHDGATIANNQGIYYAVVPQTGNSNTSGANTPIAAHNYASIPQAAAMIPVIPAPAPIADTSKPTISAAPELSFKIALPEIKPASNQSPQFAPTSPVTQAPFAIVPIQAPLSAPQLSFGPAGLPAFQYQPSSASPIPLQTNPLTIPNSNVPHIPIAPAHLADKNIKKTLKDVKKSLKRQLKSNSENTSSPCSIMWDNEPATLSTNFSKPSIFSISDLNTRPNKMAAWIEYYANLMIESEDMKRAKEVIALFGQYVTVVPSLSNKIMTALQSLQNRLLNSTMTSNGRCNSQNCRVAWESSPNTINTDFDQLMENIPFSATGSLYSRDRQTLEQIYIAITRGNLPVATDLFESLIRGRGSLLRSEAVGKLNFVLKMIRFDLENRDICMPLWSDYGQFNWRQKSRILDAFDALKRRTRDMSDIWRMLQCILKQRANEIWTRMGIALGDQQAWSQLGLLPRADQYLAQGCLMSRGVSFPNTAPTIPQPYIVRNQVKQVYQQCIMDPTLAQVETVKCRDALNQIYDIERTCPVLTGPRLGIVALFLGDQLIQRCPYIPVVLRPIQRPPVPAPKTKPCIDKARIHRLRILQRHLQFLEKDLRQIPTSKCHKDQKWNRSRRVMRQKIGKWRRRLDKYLQKVDGTGKLHRRMRPSLKRRPSASKIIRELREAIGLE